MLALEPQCNRPLRQIGQPPGAVVISLLPHMDRRLATTHPTAAPACGNHGGAGAVVGSFVPPGTRVMQSTAPPACAQSAENGTVRAPLHIIFCMCGIS